MAGKAKELKFTSELNKAACFLKLQMFGEAKVACRLVLEEQGRNVKALFRRAQAYTGSPVQNSHSATSS